MSNTTKQTAPQVPYSPEVQQVLRLAGKDACRRATLNDLSRALHEDQVAVLPKARVWVDQELARTIDRAVGLAIAQDAKSVTRQHLLEALIEMQGAAGQLKPEMLRFHRWRAGRIAR